MTGRRTPSEIPALDAAGLERLALGYVGRYATSRAKLRRYLERKLRERGWSEATTPDPAAIVERLAGLGYVDDALLAQSRGRALARAGFGVRRVAAALDALGIARGEAQPTLDEAATDGFARALRFAERRRIGPFAPAAMDERGRHRAFAAMMRAGHAPEHARKIIAAAPGAILAADE